jgi:hypothetical protein
MNLLNPINRLLDSVDILLGGSRALQFDGSMDLDRLRYKQGEGLNAVSVSMSRIARPILAQTMIEVREKKRKQTPSSTR